MTYKEYVLDMLGSEPVKKMTVVVEHGLGPDESISCTVIDMAEFKKPKPPELLYDLIAEEYLVLKGSRRNDSLTFTVAGDFKSARSLRDE